MAGPESARYGNMQENAGFEGSEDHADSVREYLRDMAVQLSDLARGVGLDQAAAYMALASLAVRKAEPESPQMAGTLTARRA